MEPKLDGWRLEAHHDPRSIESWERDAYLSQRTADERRTQEVNARDARRRAIGLLLCLLTVVIIAAIIGIPR